MESTFGKPVLLDRHQNSNTLNAVHIGGGDAKNEEWLRDLIQLHPECLPIDQIEPGFQSVVPVCTELPTDHGYIDNLLITPEGNLVIVEVKLWRNPEARRKVIAQALDYASCLFELDYEGLEAAVKKARFVGNEKPEKLYDLITDMEADVLPEADFVDAINANLRRGRAIILVVGDGIRSETARLAQLLQSHAGAHFTFALVEMAVFEMPGDNEWLLCPRTLCRTEMIPRGVVHVKDSRTQIAMPETAELGSTRAHNITAEEFFESMSKIDPALPSQIQSFLDMLSPLGVYPQFLRSLNLKWDPPEGTKAVNLGYILRNGHVWTDASNWFAPKHLSHQYNEELAEAFEIDVEKEVYTENWHIRVDGRAPRIEELAPQLNEWAPVISRFLDRLRTHFSEQIT